MRFTKGKLLCQTQQYARKKEGIHQAGHINYAWTWLMSFMDQKGPQIKSVWVYKLLIKYSTVAASLSCYK